MEDLKKLEIIAGDCGIIEVSFEEEDVSITPPIKVLKGSVSETGELTFETGIPRWANAYGRLNKDADSYLFCRILSKDEDYKKG